MRKQGMAIVAVAIKSKNNWLLITALWLAVLLSAMAVIRSTHIARGQHNDLEVMRREAAHLHVVWGQYLLEQSTWSAYSRIEKEAVEQLKMQVPNGEQLVMVQ